MEWAKYPDIFSQQSLATFDAGIKKLENLVFELSEDTDEPRGQINLIRRKMPKIFLVYPGDPATVKIDEKELNDVEVMIRDLFEEDK
jgi:hypothetical protein